MRRQHDKLRREQWLFTPLGYRGCHIFQGAVTDTSASASPKPRTFMGGLRWLLALTNPTGYKQHPKTQLLASVYRSITETVPANPADPVFLFATKTLLI